MDDQINNGDWVYLGNTTRIFKVKMSDSDFSINGNMMYTLVDPYTKAFTDAERTRIRKIVDTTLINSLNQQYSDL
jgi:hypothetical protein